MKKFDKKPSKGTVYKIDQSGKIEYTSHDTVVAYSNSSKKAILISAKEKRLLQERFREIGKRQIFTYRIFSLLVFLLLKNEQFETIVIDIEYPGRGDLIKNYLLHDFARVGRKVDPDNIDSIRSVRTARHIGTDIMFLKAIGSQRWW